MPVIPSPVLNRGCLPVCAWIKPTTFPLFPGICDASGSLSRPVFTISTVGAFGLTMRWLGAQISSPVADCGNSNPYVSAFGSGGANRFVLDPIRAYSDGAWVSSTVIDLFHINLNGTAPTPRSLRGAWGQCAAQQLTFPTSGAGPNCATNHVATLTLFDDGSFTLTA